MLRFVALGVLVFLVFLVVRATVHSFFAGLRAGPSGARPRPAIRDELVKDPVCGTYIPRRKSIARGSGATVHYFCSAACADRFASRA